MKNLKFNFVLLVLLLFSVKALHAQTSSFSASPATLQPPEFSMTITQYSDPLSPWEAKLLCEVVIIGAHPNWESAQMKDSWGSNMSNCGGSCTFTWSYPRATRAFPIDITCMGMIGGIEAVILDNCVVVIEPCVGCSNQ